MGKVIGLLLTVLCIWAGLEVYNNGLDGAFGGAFANRSAGEARGSTASIPQRAGAAVGGAHAEADARRERLLGE